MKSTLLLLCLLLPGITACGNSGARNGEIRKQASRVSGEAVQSIPDDGKDTPTAPRYPEEGTPTPPNPLKEKHIRYIIGEPAAAGAWPFAASLLLQQGPHYYHYCGGSLINRQWILTAAHCQPKVGNYVLLGRYDLRRNDGVLVKIDRVLPHPSYDPATYDNDLALVRLAAVVDLGIPPMRFDVPPAFGQSVTAIGWGALKPDGRQSAILQQVTVPVRDTTSCRASYQEHRPPLLVTDNMICAGEDGKDSCDGDSGGPLLSGDPASPAQVGVVSFGSGCGQRAYPGVYTRVDHYLSWITANAV